MKNVTPWRIHVHYKSRRGISTHESFLIVADSYEEAMPVARKAVVLKYEGAEILDAYPDGKGAEIWMDL